MLILPPSVRIYVATAVTDMRRGFDGLSALVRETLGGDPGSGDLFVFRNKAGDKLKILFASRQGLGGTPDSIRSAAAASLEEDDHQSMSAPRPRRMEMDPERVNRALGIAARMNNFIPCFGV